MIREEAEVVVLGAGFAGSLTALVLKQTGRRVVLVERGRHPRFALGESSTPLANLVLAEISREYDLPALLPLAKYGSWKRTYPHLVCGPKRGFTFAAHVSGEPFVPCPRHGNELLVTASPDDEIADTHWLRADIDHFVVQQAISAGVMYLDHTVLECIEPGSKASCRTAFPGRPDGPEGPSYADRWHLAGQREGEPVVLTASFVIDATGPAGVLAKALHINTTPDAMRTKSWSVFNHFVAVERWESLLSEQGGRTDDHPYHCDDAALHHVFDDGWMWVLRFDNGVTSAGFLLDGSKCQPDLSITPEEEWARILARLPSVARQFHRAQPILPWTRTGRLQRRSGRTAGENWAMLAPSAYTLDALYSTGNAHALLTIQRLARILSRGWGSDLGDALTNYDQMLQREMTFLDMLVHGSYLAFGRFELLASFTMYYFAGAIAAEERRKQGRAAAEDEFLSSHIAEFRAGFERGYWTLRELCRQERPDIEEFARQVAADIAPWNTVGLCDARKRNMYPY